MVQGSPVSSGTMSDSLLLRKSGTLLKKGAVRHSWRKRFFGLTQDDLKYWTSSGRALMPGREEGEGEGEGGEWREVRKVGVMLRGR